MTRGYAQREGVDYFDFASVIRYESIRMLLVIAVREDYKIAQFDVKSGLLIWYFKRENLYGAATRF